MAANLEIVITGDSSSAMKAFREVSGGFKEVSSGAGGASKALADVAKIASGFVIGAGLMKLPGLISSVTDAASNLGESVNAVQVVFGKSADKLADFSKTASQSVGLSQRAFNELATPLGAMLKNLGNDTDEAADKTVMLTKRAADMASVFNTDVNDAVGAITAALRGETDPIERYGVSVNAKVEVEAMAMTGKKTAASLTDQEKATARLNLIMRQTDSVAGDFANTSDGLANKQRIQKARQEDLSASIGTKLLPAMIAFKGVQLEAVTFIADKLIPIFSRYADVVQNKVGQAWQAAQPYVQQAMQFLQTTIVPFLQEQIPVALQRLGAFVQSEFAKFQTYYESDIAPALANIRTGVEVAVNFISEHWPQIERVVRPVLQEVQNRIQTTVAIVSAAFAIIVDLIGGDFSGAWTRLKDLAATVWTSIKESVSNGLELIKALAPVAKAAGDVLMNAIWDGLLAVWDHIKEWLPKLPGAMVDALSDLGPKLFKLGEDAGGQLWEGFKKGAASLPGAAWDALKGSLPSISAPQFRDSGGPVSAGMPYAIGRGAQPELFVPNTGGTMYPRGSYPNGGGAPGVIHVHLELDKREIARTIVDLKNGGALRGAFA